MYPQKEYAMKLWRNGFSNCFCLRLSDRTRNFLFSFTFSVVEVSDFILYKYEPIIRQFGVIGATRPFSLLRTNLHVLGEMSKEHGKIKRYTGRSGTARSRSRIKIIYTTFTRRLSPHARIDLLRLNFLCNFSRMANSCMRASAISCRN